VNGAIPAIELRDLSKDYGSGDSALTVLKDLSLKIEEGEFVGVVGASGSGKTTLMNILGCLDSPTRGKFLLNGMDVSTYDDNRLSMIRNRAIGFVFQSFNLVEQLTVMENVEVPLFYNRTPRRERRALCLRQLEAVGLTHRLGHHPSQLSGGECQRVAIARALANDPAILLTDEPTGNLDTKTGGEVLNLFHELHRDGRTIIMVTHNPEIASSLPRVIEMRDGRVEENVAVGGFLERMEVH
jgi:putative ABC transport system ATP-binding protein